MSSIAGEPGLTLARERSQAAVAQAKTVEDWLTGYDLERRYGISTRTIRAAAARGEFASEESGGIRYFDPAGFERWARRLKLIGPTCCFSVHES